MSDIEKSEIKETIEKYCLGLMTSSEKQAFERKLQSDEPLNAQLEALRPVILGLKLSEIKDSIQDIHHTSQTRKNRTQLVLISGIAASVALFFVMFSLFFQGSDQALFGKYFLPYPDVVTKRTSGTSSSNGMSFYRQGDYQNAIKSFNEHQDKTNEVLFYLAISYLAIQEGEKAIEILKSEELQHSRFKNLVNWYLALGYLLVKDTTKCQELLEGKVIQESSYKDKAKELMNELQRQNSDARTDFKPGTRVKK